MSGLLVVNADDLGLSQEINAGILWGIDCGLITDTSVLVKAPYADQAISGLVSSGIRHAGIHINLDGVLGWRPGGIEQRSRAVLSTLLNDEAFLEKCTCEARTQIEIFLSSGLIPTHLDTHHHVHGFPSIFEILMGLCTEYRIPAVRFSRLGYHLSTREAIPFDERIYACMEETLRCRGVIFCQHLLEGARCLDQVGHGTTELVVHPSLGGETWRAMELETLREFGGDGGIVRRDLRLVSFRGLLREVMPGS
jgi:predicted glycoside hydrolase/deacetylase ChbG (UPF0249 family)